MPDQPFRFLHASDLQIDHPVSELSQIHEHLRDLLIDAPFLAAKRVFETAVRQKVSFVLLSGNMLDLVNPTARALAFLRDQFDLLNEHEIPVFWAGGGNDSGDQWPGAVTLPESVHHFGSSVTQCEVADDIVVVGCSQRGTDAIRAENFQRESGGRLSIAVVPGVADPRRLSRLPIDYWALGGRNDRKTVFSEPHVAHYAGTAQGRSPQDVGPHGCTLVEVAPGQALRMRFIPCDAVRWQHECVTIGPKMKWEDVDRLLTDRLQNMRSRSPVPLLVKWTFSAGDESVDVSSLRNTVARATERLHQATSGSGEPCWTVAVEVDDAVQIPTAWQDEDTLLGDYLRAVGQLEDDPDAPILDQAFVPNGSADDFSDPAARADVLRRASALGASLLRGDDKGT